MRLDPIQVVVATGLVYLLTGKAVQVWTYWAMPPEITRAREVSQQRVIETSRVFSAGFVAGLYRAVFIWSWPVWLPLCVLVTWGRWRGAGAEDDDA